ncbi:phenol 2-monooxygenase [Fusarium coicis]|nr:phenol 2-monooxygenase [Fusarium coicis]
MSSAITTSVLMLEYTGAANLVAEVIGANPKATTFVLDCDKPKYKKTWDENECYMTKETVILGSWADKTPAPGAVTTGIWRRGTVNEDEKEGYSVSVECEMDYTMPKVCTTTNHPSFTFDDDRQVTATYTKHGGTTFDGFFYFGYGYFGWAPVTVTAGQSYLLSAKTAASTEATATSDVSGTGKAEEATTSAAETTSTNDDGVITVTGEASSTTTASNSAGTKRALSLWAAVGIATTVVLDYGHVIRGGPKVNTDILIVGAGPSGAALASFLGQNGMRGLVISKESHTAYTPRAHGFNPFALECLRDINLEDEVLRLAIREPLILSSRFAQSLIGEEYGRIAAWEENPRSSGRRQETTPCEYVDFSQRHLEPLLLRYASHNGFNIRFSTEILNAETISSPAAERAYMCTVYDHILKQEFKIYTKYLFGADGARSQVARQFDFNFLTQSPGPKACNVLFRADLSRHLTKSRLCGMHWIIQPDRALFSGVVAHLRAVRPWNEWVLVAFGPQGGNPFEGMTAQSHELVDLIRKLVGDDSLDVEILTLDAWTVRESVAETYSNEDQNLFLLGDAAHRHPPTFGLGSNTCIQDAYNLAWKVAYVSKGWAGPGLMASYSQERQPVGADLVRESNKHIRKNAGLFRVFGMMAPSAEGTKQVDQLSHATPEGSTRRANLHVALEEKKQEFESLGLAHNHFYVSSAVYLGDEPSPRPELQGDSVVEVQISTYPGSRLPHAWIDKPNRLDMISTLDLAGKGSFCLLVSVDGGAWRSAAEAVMASIGIPIKVFGIGPGQEYIDVYRHWYEKRGVSDSGCVLVRPDRFVAWRSVGESVDCGHLSLAATGHFVLLLCIVYLLYNVTFTIFFNPLSRLPGPWISCWSDMIAKYHWLKGTRAQYVHDLHQQYGPVVRIGPHEVDISDMAAVKEIHRVKDGYRKAAFYKNLVPNTNNLFNTLDVEFHRHHRRLLSSPLSESSLKAVEPIVDAYVNMAIDSMKREMDERGAADVAKVWLFMATDIIVELSFGESFGILKQGKKNQYIEDLEGLAAKGSIRSTFPTLISLATKLPLPVFKETVAATQRIKDYSAEAVARYKRDFANNPAAAKPMLFRKLFEAGEEGLSDDEIRAEAQAYIVAGTDTTATTLTYLIYSVCRHADVRQKLVKELMGLIDGFGHNDLRDLPYLNNVIDETLRLYAAVPAALPRVVPAGGAHLAGYFIPGDTVVSTQAWTLHRDQQVFSDPENWDPSRWEKGSKMMHDAVMPFGGGSRVCIGKHLARMELRLATARFFRAFPDAKVSSIEGMSEEEMELRAYFLLSPKGGRCLIQLE